MKTIEGQRAVVDLSEDGSGWSCRGCRGAAGPFADGEVSGVWRTGTEHAVRSAAAHANERCAGKAAITWRREEARRKARESGQLTKEARDE